MKEAVDKANWSSPEDKIPVLREMIEVYRDRLKLDVMVVNAFTQILNIQPTNFQAADELAAQYETMKRWPDLISLLRKKASVVEAPAEKVALQLRIANLFLEKFSNQAEAIKAFEAILEIDPENADALAFVKQMYEKRRDWEKLVAVHQREIEKIADARRAPGPPRRGGQARLREDEEGVGLDRPLAEGARRRRRERRGARRAGEAVRAREDVERARRRAGAAGGGGADATRRVGDLRQAGRALHREGAERRRRRRRPGRRCCRRSRTTGARRTRSRSSICSRRTGTPSRGSTPRRGSGTSWCASSSARPSPRTGAARVGLWNKIGELYRDRLQKADRAQKAYEKVLSFDGKNLAGRARR